MNKIVKDSRMCGDVKCYFGERADLRMKVPKDILECVCFLGFQDQASFPKKTEYHATGFHVAVHGERTNAVFHYVVTAKHVAEELKEFAVCATRLNTKDGKSMEVLSEHGEIRWHYHQTDNATDVAVASFLMPGDEIVFPAISDTSFLNPETITFYGIGPGDNVIIVGLFSYHVGKSRNLPVVRTGNISMMQDELIRTKIGDVHGYLIEARSIGGMSGSPVFALKELYPNVEEAERSGESEFASHRIHFLGMIQGHWDLKEGDQVSSRRKDSKEEKINTGMAIVTPAYKIYEALRCEALKKEREAWESAIIERASPTNDKK